jgi:excisionase family DNA binding protein
VPQHDSWLTINQAADDVQVTIRTIYRWIADGRLRAYRIGPRVVRIKASDLARAAKPVRVA